MTFDQLRYFFEAARFQHVGKAAKAVHISPSAISAAIAALEDELGAALFDRLGKTIALTDAGKKLQKETESLLDQLNGVKNRVTGKEHSLTGYYRLGASHFLASRVLSRAWSKLQEAHPELVGEISSLPTALVVEQVISGALDFGLCFSPFQHPDLHQEIIYKGQLQVAVRANHPLSKMNLENRKSCQALSDYPAAIHKDSAGVDICEHHPIFDQFGIKTKPRFLFNSDSCAVEKVIHSDAWTFVPDVVVKQNAKKLKSLDLPANWNAPYSIVVIIRRDRMKNGVLEKIKAQVAELCDSISS